MSQPGVFYWEVPSSRKQHRTLHRAREALPFPGPGNQCSCLCPLHQPRPCLCPSLSLLLLLPIWPTICGYLPLCYCPHPSNQPIALSPCSLSLFPALTWVSPQLRSQVGNKSYQCTG